MKWCAIFLCLLLPSIALAQTCGDNNCDTGEDCVNCFTDCPQYPCCGANGCESGENCANCAADCVCGSYEHCDSMAGSCACDYQWCSASGCCASSTDVCNSYGYCCGPDCNGKECGDDGCGGSCGSCSSPEVCVGTDCTTCGNSSCDNYYPYYENCGNCDDCACPSGQHCDSGNCVSDEYCGDNICNNGENCTTCSMDCGCSSGQVCDNGTCTYCGNASCESWYGENCDNCADCACGSGWHCDNGSCVQDPYCGDMQCNNGETCVTCWSDCQTWPCCGQNGCESGYGENCDNCEADCACGTGQHCDNGSCVNDPYCGDSYCNNGETCATCWTDCAQYPCCGVNGCETWYGETCDCPEDCPCGPNEECSSSTCTCKYEYCSGTGCCDDGQVCDSSNYCCTPDCNGKSCGPNGCDGDCGTCPTGSICNSSGQCVPYRQRSTMGAGAWDWRPYVGGSFSCNVK